MNLQRYLLEFRGDVIHAAGDGLHNAERKWLIFSKRISGIAWRCIYLRAVSFELSRDSAVPDLNLLRFFRGRVFNIGRLDRLLLFDYSEKA